MFLSILWAVVCGVAMMGMGRVVVATLDSPTAWAHAWCAGLLLWGLAGLGFGWVGQWNETTAIGLVLVSLVGWLRHRKTSQRSDLVWIVPIAVLLLSPSLMDAVGPVIGTDEQYLHVGLPAQLFLHGEFLSGVLHPNGSRPLTLQMAYSSAIATGTPNSASILHWSMSVGLFGLMVQCARDHLGSIGAGFLGISVLAASTTIQTAAGMAGSDIPTAFAVLACLDAALRKDKRALAIAAGLAISIKYTAAAPLVGIFLIAPIGFRHRLFIGIMAILTVSPWWVRNLFDGLHPLFPFTGWPDPQVTFQYLEKYGAGRDWQDFLLLPWRAIFDTETHNFRFLGQIHPFFLLMLLPAPLAMNSRQLRPWLASAMFGFIGWSIGPHWLRYLIPTLPLSALAGSAMTLRVLKSGKSKALLTLLFIGGMAVGWKDMPQHIAKNWSALQKPPHRSGTSTFKFCNENLPTDATVALLFEWQSTEIRRRQILGSLEDHVPTRHFLLRNTGREVEALIAAGATHAVVRKTLFLEKFYPFLNAEQLDQDFHAPVTNLDVALREQAVLLYRSHTHRVYRLTAQP